MSTDEKCNTELTKFEALALALSLGKREELAAYAEAECKRLWPEHEIRDHDALA